MRSSVKVFTKFSIECQLVLMKVDRATKLVVRFALIIFLMLIKTKNIKTLIHKSQRSYTGLIERHSNMPVVGMDTTFAINLMQ